MCIFREIIHIIRFRFVCEHIGFNLNLSPVRPLLAKLFLFLSQASDYHIVKTKLQVKTDNPHSEGPLSSLAPMWNALFALIGLRISFSEN